MKKILLLSAAMLNISLSGLAYENMAPVEKSTEMMEYLPNKDLNLTFVDNPLKFLEAIQLDYHFSEFDQGLKRVDEALAYVEPIYNENKDQAIFPDQLSDAAAYKVYSGLLTLKGMMLDKKAISFAGANADEDKEGIRAQAVENMRMAQENLAKAVEVDGNSAEAHFQLGKYYRDASAGLSSEEAEKAFYTAAKLAKEQGNDKGSEQALNELRTINPESPYIEELK
ncbi:MAG: hypothetical protein ACK5LE_02680 [Alphaproteobacteria bacterium]